ncbi:MAG: hypothetical protein KBC38_00400 [Candidatus Pacebacteria bacterium]|nr:hypothetical protein [Candidatus Paceibacterota bacterium]MBP9840457.1 hypothetical protein [Candidatus Paceibacterota bacterium]
MARKLLLSAACALMLIGCSSAAPTYEGPLPPNILPATVQTDDLGRLLFVRTDAASATFGENAVRIRVAAMKQECAQNAHWH